MLRLKGATGKHTRERKHTQKARKVDRLEKWNANQTKMKKMLLSKVGKHQKNQIATKVDQRLRKPKTTHTQKKIVVNVTKAWPKTKIVKKMGPNEDY